MRLKRNKVNNNPIQFWQLICFCSLMEAESIEVLKEAVQLSQYNEWAPDWNTQESVFSQRQL
jgi:hypothetical protein